MELTDRQKFLLTLAVHDYIKTAQPVSSQHMVQRYGLEMSSATVRNELAALTEMGYLRQPHTSAGRVPTEEGYRFFVSRAMQQSELPPAMRHTISHQFYQTRQDIEQWMRLAASVLANQSRAASLVTSPHPDQARIKHIELISTRGRQVLLVMVLMGGELHQQMLTLSGPTSQDHLSQASNHLTSACQGLDGAGLGTLTESFSPLEIEVLEAIQKDLNRAENLVAGEVFLDGLTNMLAEPEFVSGEEARRALRVLEERSMLEDFLARTVMTSAPGGVQVLIGGEGTWDELRQCSVVLARYGIPGVTGILGVLGPMRMPYGRTISTVRFVASLLSDMVSESLA